MRGVEASGRIAFIGGTFGFTPDSVAALDTMCAARASDAGWSGRSRPPVAATTASAASRSTTAGPPWVRTDGIAVVASATDLFAPGGPVMTAALDISEFGMTFTSAGVTTGATRLLSPSLATLHCDGFTTGRPRVPDRGQPA